MNPSQSNIDKLVECYFEKLNEGVVEKMSVRIEERIVRCIEEKVIERVVEKVSEKVEERLIRCIEEKVIEKIIQNLDTEDISCNVTINSEPNYYKFEDLQDVNSQKSLLAIDKKPFEPIQDFNNKFTESYSYTYAKDQGIERLCDFYK